MVATLNVPQKENFVAQGFADWQTPHHFAPTVSNWSAWAWLNPSSSNPSAIIAFDITLLNFTLYLLKLNETFETITVNIATFVPNQSKIKTAMI